MSSSSRVIKEAQLPGDSWCTIRGAPGGHEFSGTRTSTTDEILATARRRAAAIVAQAGAQAREIVAEAEETAQRLLQEAQQKGLAQGREAGHAEGLKRARLESEATIHRLAELAHQAEEEQARLLGQMEGQMVELALAIARRVVSEELTFRPEAVAEIVARAIEEARGGGHHVIRLHPADADLLSSYLPRAAIEAGGNEWEIRADDSLQRGDCLIETAFGLVDARIDTQFSELTYVLRGSQAEDEHR